MILDDISTYNINHIYEHNFLFLQLSKCLYLVNSNSIDDI